MANSNQVMLVKMKGIIKIKHIILSRNINENLNKIAKINRHIFHEIIEL